MFLYLTISGDQLILFISSKKHHHECFRILFRKSLSFEMFQSCFTENPITGRTLIYIDCSSLPRNFQHVKMISAHIRERSVADGPEDDMTVFLKMKSHTGQRAESITYDQIKNICLK
ncbi:sterile alpha motif domain-containing protein 15-like [Triplophysa rosa]|uniref:sterile alpha motif domain-containing protein 15-like n=1 Tax=Triplophysa rosa TaxID=992332 RepID=UPI002545C988|nr:sterile alpha motif domain-containing protein 15-like [Triplophysa rosa]